eukprot:PITA_27092
MKFILERETFTSVLVWVRLYSLPLDYWQHGSLATIGNKLGCFVKASKATRMGKYTSYAKICVEVDLLGALPEELILEVFDEEWVQTVDYEHITFICCRCHEHGHLIRDCPLSKVDNRGEPKTGKDNESFHKVESKGKGGRNGSRQQCSEGKNINTNRFQVLEEKEEMSSEDKAMKEGPKQKEKEENYIIKQEICNRKETMNREPEAEMDMEMTQSETNMEDHELQEILEKEHLDLGLGSRRKQRFLSYRMKKDMPDMIFIQETKCSIQKIRLINSKWLFRYEFLEVNSKNTMGGILTLWNPQRINVLDAEASRNYLSVVIQPVGVLETFLVKNVYGPQNLEDKLKLLEALTDLKSRQTRKPWILGGDFNMIKYLSEKKELQEYSTKIP